MSGTGQAFNSLSCWVSYPVTKGHRTNTQRNDVLEGGKEKRRQGAENKIKEACILYATVGLSHSTREIWQQRKALHRLKPFLCFFFCFFEALKSDVVAAYVLFARIHTEVCLLRFLSFFAETHASSLVHVSTQDVMSGEKSGQIKFVTRVRLQKRVD